MITKLLLPKLGFARPKVSFVPTHSHVLGAVESGSMQRALSSWLAQLVATGPPMRLEQKAALTVVSVDGKTSRAAGVHVLGVFLYDLELVLHQEAVEGKQSVHQELMGRFQGPE